ncbi:hypothetical protein CDD80_7581 [Ophiocordyceps camponoti-rufipedis]|uniref:Cell wall proline rich protein n=1 Tax=Ophiocordyceps camponoti-rufipedis TaxID=2004952 RepID=A0A2C5YMW2_9HYPO|nr:hypothetical protein CDD80_7581 [Ophiocordyceps camponoti-rufipedis]
MIATARGPSWGPPNAASHAHSLEDSAARSFFSADLPRGSDADVVRRSSPTPPDVPPPNPPFVFPARLASQSSTSSLYARTRASRPSSTAESDPPSSPSRENADRPPRKGLALPAFSFNPGASLGQDSESSAFLSPPISPASLSPTLAPSPLRPTRHGHRRGGSEFIGGSVRDGNSIALLSTSPTKSDSGFASASALAPPSRRHRRGLSGAVSAHDLSQLSRPPTHVMPRGSSAPNSPTYFTLVRDIPFPAPEGDLGTPETLHLCRDAKGLSDDTMESARPTTPVANASDAEPSSPRQARLGRTRVGFSDKLEFIPRPLSLVSSDTSSTATARPGHSVSGSISSVVSIVSPSGRENPNVLSKSPVREPDGSRPSTAGAVLEGLANSPPSCLATNASPRRRNSTPTLLTVIEGTQAPVQASKAPKRWSFFGFESSFITSSPAGPAKSRPSSSSSSSESAPRLVSASSSSDHESDSTETGKEADVSGRQPANKRSRKKRVKGWAGSILPRKSKGHKKHQPPTGLQPSRTLPAPVDHLEDIDQDTDDSETPGPNSPTFQFNLVEPTPTAQDFPADRRPSRDDALYPMIDLDAALGPFNTPLPLNPEWEAAQRAAGYKGKRRMHSAQGMKNFSGPGMHYHRRAESAPDLPPFDFGSSGVHRFNSNSTMADVFEEDEDEEGIVSAKDQAAKRETGQLAVPRGSDVAVPPNSAALVAAPPLDTSVDEVEPEKKTLSSFSRAPCPQGPMLQEAAEESPSIIFCSANALFSGPDSPKRLPTTPEVSPAEMHTAPLSPRSTTHTSSSHASPRSPTSTDTPRLSAAPSSTTDKNSLQSLLMGEPGPEVRISADYDMRSLASSNSTMTRDSTFGPSQRTSQPSFREQRPVSVSSAAFGRRRSSLVSLSRLISSAHGERSKLSMEVTLDNESEAKRSKSVGTKTKERLGRMIQFWKPKDGTPPEARGAT